MNDRIKQAEAELAAAIKAAADQEAKDAFRTRLEGDLNLAEATIVLLTSVRQLVDYGRASAAVAKELLHFRKELAPLAESYGVKIVLVGDKTTATVVLA